MRGRISEFKKEYLKIKYINCPAFSCEKVYFNKYGLQHIFWKGRKYRKVSDVMRRIKLFPFTTQILLREVTTYEHRIIESKNRLTHFWTIRLKIGLLYIRVVVRQINNGNKHFFSVMSE